MIKWILFLFLFSNAVAEFSIGRLKYSGGGDWYSNPSSLPNLQKALANELGMSTTNREITVSLKDDSAWKTSILYATGHGNINFSELEAEKLRAYLLSGGFLWVDDNCGMDPYFRSHIKKVFPEKELEPLSASHPIYHCYYSLEGLPKIHEHEGDPAQGYAIFHNGRMILYYSFSSDIGDGLEDVNVHNDPEPIRELAKQFAVNLVYYVLNH
jgi:hypothetical protein